jgi:hypothetical protein
MSCSATTHYPAARALPQPRRALRVLVSRLQRLYVNLAVRRGTRPRLQRLYINYATRPGASARRAARPRLVAPLVVDNSASRRLVVDYFISAARLGASAHRSAHHAARRAARHRLLCLAQARRRLLRLHLASGCLGTSRGSSRGSSCRSSSTTPPRAGSSSTTSPLPRVRVPRHVARLVTRLIAPLVVDYSNSRRLVVDYFTSAACPGASARRAARHAARHAARRQLLRLAQARRRLLRLRRASGCLGTSRGSSCGSSLTTSPTPCVRVPRHVTRLVVDYFACIARPGALLVAQLVVDYFAYAV